MVDPEHLLLPTGARLDYFLAGAGDALLVYHHGTPAAGPIASDMAEAAARNGFVIAELVRPGYGHSTRQPGRTVADVVPLVAALADHLGFDRFATFGWSGGGPHAIATAALIPDRCTAALSLAGVAPFEAEGLDFLAGMGEDNIAEFGAALAGQAELEAFLAEASAPLVSITGDEVVGALLSLLPPADQSFLTGEQGEAMAEELRWSVSTGFWGWYDDDIAFCRPWGFDLSAITPPVSIWQGSDDLMVPLAHGQWLAANVGGASARLLEGHGHLSPSHEVFDSGFAQLRAAL